MDAHIIQEEAHLLGGFEGFEHEPADLDHLLLREGTRQRGADELAAAVDGEAAARKPLDTGGFALAGEGF